MSGKKTNGDLTALYRLEFYRKQNNWKFCSEVHQKVRKASSKGKSKAADQHVQHSDVKDLNKTFIVQRETEGNEERSDLNNAFMESDNDKNLTTPQNSPSIPAKNWSPEFIQTSDRWTPQDTQNNEVPTEQSPDNLNLTHPKIKFSKLGLYLPNPAQNWQPDEIVDCNWQGQATETWSPSVKEDQNPQDTYDQNVPEQTAFDPHWLQQQMVSCMNKIDNQAENEQKIKNAERQSVVMQSWENIANQSNEKYQDLNNNSPLDFTPVKNMPEPILENWQEWQETQISSNTNTLQKLPEDWPDGMVWQDQCKELPEMDKEGYEGNEARWPLETQIWTNHKLVPENVWSDEVLRELELLNAQDVNTNIPSQAEKWVPPDRLLQWMLANKECCDDVLETSCESEGQFMRAAHSVPHSSEIDIRLPTEDNPLGLECGGLLTDAVDVLSEAALMAAGRAHARALHRVAMELRNREQQHSTNVPAITEGEYDGSCEEYPTRDIGLYQPTFIDTFISGSHKNNPNIKTLDKPKENNMDVNFNCNQLDGGIMVDKVDRQIKVNRGLGKSDLNMGQSVVNTGQSDVNMRQSDVNVGQIDVNMGQCDTNMGRSDMIMRQSDKNIGPSDMNMGQNYITMRHSDKNMGQNSLNMGQNYTNMGQSDKNISPSGANIAQSGMLKGQTGNKSQNSLNLSQTEVGWNHQDLDMGQDRNHLFPNRLPDCQLCITGQSCSISDCNIIGRGRGRLPLKEPQILPGRGRGRKEVKMSSHLL